MADGAGSGAAEASAGEDAQFPAAHVEEILAALSREAVTAFARYHTAVARAAGAADHVVSGRSEKVVVTGHGRDRALSRTAVVRRSEAWLEGACVTEFTT